MTISTMPVGVIEQDFKLVELVVPEAWPATWIHRAGWYEGRIIRGSTGWARVLCASLAPLALQIRREGPFGGGQLARDLGALLALVEAELDGDGRRIWSVPPPTLASRFMDAMRQHASEPGLTAARIACRLHVSERTLHRACATIGESFAAILARERIALAIRMLQAPAFLRLPVAEIGRRAGFADASYFGRAFRQALGRSPGEYRDAHRRL